MRVLQLSSLYPPGSVGGAERVVEVLAEGLARRGVEVAASYLTREPQAASQRGGVSLQPLAHRNPLWIETSARHSGLQRKFNKLVTLFNPLTAADFTRLLREFRPHIVHSHSMVELTPHMWRSAKEHGAVLVHTLHDYDLLCIRATLFMDGQRCQTPHRSCAAFSRVKRHYHQAIDHVVGVSQAILQTHLEHGLFAGLAPAQRHVIWNPVQRASSAAPPARTRTGPFTFGFLGRLVPEKGVEVLLRACRLLAQPDWCVKIAGKAPGDDAWLRQAAEGLPVELVGYVDPSAYFQDIDVLIVPSIWLEPFGLTIIEAYAAGVPVIGSRIAGVAEIVSAVDPDALFAPDDPQALADKMGALARAGRAALPVVDSAEVLRRTHPDRVVDSYHQLYQRAAAPAVSG